MNQLSEYLATIVDPTFDDFKRNPGSVRHAFLACVATYHAIDRVTFPKSARMLRQIWCKEFIPFKLVDIVAHHFKHVESNDERIAPTHAGIPIGFALGLSKTSSLETRNLYFIIRDAIKFLHSKADQAQDAKNGTKARNDSDRT